jgi:hypothetical protein
MKIHFKKTRSSLLDDWMHLQIKIVDGVVEGAASRGD